MYAINMLTNNNGNTAMSAYADNNQCARVLPPDNMQYVKCKCNMNNNSYVNNNGQCNKCSNNTATINNNIAIILNKWNN